MEYLKEPMVFMKDNLKMGKRKVEEDLLSQMERFMKENGN